MAGLFGISCHASGVQLQLNERHKKKWHAILNPQPPSSYSLFSVVLSYSHSAVRVGRAKMAFWLTLSFWVLVGKGALDKWWCASHDCLPLRVTPPSDTLGKIQITAVLNEKCQPDVKDTLLFLHFAPFYVYFADFIVYIITKNRHACKQSTS